MVPTTEYNIKTRERERTKKNNVALCCRLSRISFLFLFSFVICFVLFFYLLIFLPKEQFQGHAKQLLLFSVQMCKKI